MPTWREVADWLEDLRQELSRKHGAPVRLRVKPRPLTLEEGLVELEMMARSGPIKEARRRRFGIPPPKTRGK